MFMYDVTFLDNQRQDNCVVAGLQGGESRNCGSIVRGQQVVSAAEHPDWICKQPILLSSADQGLFLLWLKVASK
jgi:hypothetical protein